MSHKIAQAVVDLHGPVVTRRLLVRAGVAPDWIRRRVTRGSWTELFPSVYWVGLEPPEEADLMSAALAFAGPDAAIARGSALRLWLGTPRPHDGIHVSVPHGRPRRRSAGVQVHQRVDHDIVRRAGLPVSSIAQTLTDLIGRMGANDVRCHAADAVRLGVLSPSGLLTGTVVRRHALVTARHIDEELRAGAWSGGECAFYRIVLSAGLPIPELNVPFLTAGGRYLLDAYWRCLQLVVEVDGRSVHAKRAAFEDDAARQNHLHIEGLLVIRFPVSLIFSNPEEVRTILELALRARAAERGLAWRDVLSGQATRKRS